MIIKLTWRNLWRNSRRTLITMASITFALMLAILMQSFQKGIFDNLVNNVVSYYQGYIQIHKQGYHNEQVLDNSFTPETASLYRLQQNPHIKALVPRLETFVLASIGNITKGCLVVGTDPEKENALTGLKKKIIQGSYFNNDTEPVTVLSEGLAKRLNIGVNDTLILLGQGYQGTMAAGKFKVKGIVHFGSPDLNEGLLFLTLPVAQSFLNAENLLSTISLAIDKPGNMLSIQKDVKTVMGKEYEVMNWEEQMPEISNHIKADTFSFYIFNGILYLIIAFGIFGTIIMMTTERRFEFGMFIAIGMKKLQLALMLLGETLLITLVGIAMGILLSLPLVLYLNKQPIRVSGNLAETYERFGFEALFPTAVHLPIFIIQSLIVLLIAILIGLYPVWYVSKIDPVTYMKN